MKKTLLVNYVYFPPIGHAIEALRYALGYHKANPNYEISLVVTKHTPYFLADLCPWIKKTYTVDLPWDTRKSRVVRGLVSHIPRSWDHVVSDERSKTTDYCPEPFFSYYQMSNEYFKAQEKKGYCGDKTIPYNPNEQLIFKLPKENNDFAKKHLQNTRFKIGLMFAGHGEPENSPSTRSWQKLVKALSQQYSDLSIYLFGKIKKSNGGTITAGISKKDISHFLNEYPNCVNCFDIGLLNQLAIVEQCGVFISPHTGFAFAVLCVGTPWLAISGTEWAEYFYNNVPFYSVLPNCIKYPCYRGMLKECRGNLKNQKKVICMTEQRIENDIPEIIKGADILINKRWEFKTCMKNHLKKLKRPSGMPDWVYSFDNFYDKYWRNR